MCLQHAVAMVVPKTQSVPTIQTDSLSKSKHTTAPKKQRTWTSTDLYDPEYTDGRNVRAPLTEESMPQRRVVLGTDASEWPRKAGSWGHVQSGPLHPLAKLLERHEHVFSQYLQQTRLALKRISILNSIMLQSGKVYPQTAVDEANRWKNISSRMDYHLNKFLTETSRDSQSMLELARKTHSVYDSAGEAEDSELSASIAAQAYLAGAAFAVPPRPVKRVDGTLPEGEARFPFAVESVISSRGKLAPVLDPVMEQFFRMDTWWELPIYAPLKLKTGEYVYPSDTELHIVWDIDQTKVVGEGTNDVELVLKCVLWWKEELQHDQNFIPSKVSDEIKKEFMEYCNQFDMEAAFTSMMHMIIRPGIKEFVQAHPQAKFWTFTNKDREDSGSIVRDVSDEDGLVGMYQEEPHEVSGRQCIDANKVALSVLDKVANEYAGIHNEEKPVIGVRGQSKDLSRIAGLIQEKRRREKKLENAKPITIILLDDKLQDAYAQCQANDRRMLCCVPAYTAVTEEHGKELQEAMEKLLPVQKLLTFFRAFREAEPAHALVQCVEIMSDDASTLLKRKGIANSPRFTYVPKVQPADQLPPPLPLFKPTSVPPDPEMIAVEEDNLDEVKPEPKA